MIVRLAKLFVVLAAAAGPAFAGPSANVVDVTPPAEPAAVVVLRGSSAPPQPWGGPPATQFSSAPPAPAATYAPVYFLPGYFQAPPRRGPRHVPPASPVRSGYPINRWDIGRAPF